MSRRAVCLASVRMILTERVLTWGHGFKMCRVAAQPVSAFPTLARSGLDGLRVTHMIDLISVRYRAVHNLINPFVSLHAVAGVLLIGDEPAVPSPSDRTLPFQAAFIGQLRLPVETRNLLTSRFHNTTIRRIGD